MGKGDFVHPMIKCLLRRWPRKSALGWRSLPGETCSWTTFEVFPSHTNIKQQYIPFWDFIMQSWIFTLYAFMDAFSITEVSLDIFSFYVCSVWFSCIWWSLLFLDLFMCTINVAGLKPMIFYISQACFRLFFWPPPHRTFVHLVHKNQLYPSWVGEFSEFGLFALFLYFIQLIICFRIHILDVFLDW